MLNFLQKNVEFFILFLKNFFTKNVKKSALLPLFYEFSFFYYFT